jgi:predicted nuclease with RNAse H fold
MAVPASFMVILGIDLSSQPRDTAACLLDCRSGKVVAEPPQVGCADERLDALIARADGVGIDAPFGWPKAFAEVVAGWVSPTWDNPLRDRLRFRLTDVEVTRYTGLRPLSVSTDKISLPAMRAMALLHRHGVIDKSGDGRFFEVYPAASLLGWKLRHQGYKGGEADRVEIRRTMLKHLCALFPDLSAPDDYADSDHAFDALIAALTAQAAMEGNTRGPNPDQMAVARIEGWIHLPTGS